MCLIDVSTRSAGPRKCQKPDVCIQCRCPREPAIARLCFSHAFRCQTIENSPPQGKPKKIKEMTAPGGCVLCGGLKGPGAAPGAGYFKATCERPGDAHEVRRTAPPAQPVGLDAPIQSAVHPKQRAAPRAALCFGTFWHRYALEDMGSHDGDHFAKEQPFERFIRPKPAGELGFNKHIDEVTTYPLT